MRPKILDAYCGSGGASMGYSMAGFDVTGVDINEQPNYPFRLIVGDAIEYILTHGCEYDVIAASPPCQFYSRATAWRGDRSKHPDLIAATRSAILKAGRPYVIENVQEARKHLLKPFLLCGSMFCLRVRRHRYFECPALERLSLPPCDHQADDFSHGHGAKQTETQYRDAMGCHWMTVHEARQAIPPVYTEYLGGCLLRALGGFT